VLWALDPLYFGLSDGAELASVEVTPPPMAGVVARPQFAARRTRQLGLTVVEHDPHFFAGRIKLDIDNRPRGLHIEDALVEVGVSHPVRIGITRAAPSGKVPLDKNCRAPPIDGRWGSPRPQPAAIAARSAAARSGSRRPP
jgi:hypothetical protein